MQSRYARMRANGALRPRAAARPAICVLAVRALVEIRCRREVCLFAVVDLRSSGSEPRSSAEFKARGAMAITSRAARNTMTAISELLANVALHVRWTAPLGVGVGVGVLSAR